MKKVVSLVLVALMAIGLAGCSGNSISEQEWNSPDFSVETTLSEITFLAPSNWRTKASEDSDKIYYYPYESNSGGMLYVFCQEVSNLDTASSEETLNSVLDGMKKNENIKISDFLEKEILTISNCPAVKAKFFQVVNGIEGESLLYVFLTKSSVYSVIATEANGLSEEFEEAAEKFVENIKVTEGKVDEESEPEAELMNETVQEYGDITLAVWLLSDGSKLEKVEINEGNTVTFLRNEDGAYLVTLFFDGTELPIEVICYTFAFSFLAENDGFMAITSGDDGGGCTFEDGKITYSFGLPIEKYEDVSPEIEAEYLLNLMSALEGAVTSIKE